MSNIDLLKVPMDVVLLVEKSRHVDITIVRRIVEGISKAFKESDVIRLGLIVFSSDPLPIADIGLDKGKILELFDEAPVLSGSPNIVKAIREALEMIDDFSDPVSVITLLILVCSCGSRASRSLKLALQSLRNMKVYPIVIILGAKVPSWLHSILDKDLILTVRWNTSPERIAIKVMDIITNILSKLSF